MNDEISYEELLELAGLTEEDLPPYELKSV